LTGHAVRRINLSDFDLASIKSTEDFNYGKVSDFTREAQDAIKWADHILLIFPHYSKKGSPGKLLKGKSADIVVTMGMPTVAYNGYYFSHGTRNLRRNILYLCSIKPVHLTYFGGVDNVKPKTLKKWFDKMHYLGEHPG